jgi:hypothetical protein
VPFVRLRPPNRTDLSIVTLPDNPWGMRQFALFTVSLLLIFPVHEFAHFLTYRFFGVDVRLTLNTASPTDQSQRFALAELAGPLLNLVIAIGAAIAFRLYRRMWLAHLALAAAMMRLVIYGLVLVAAMITGSGLSLGNDEPTAARLAGLPSLTFVGVFAVPFAWVVHVVVKAMYSGVVRRLRYVLLLAFITLCVGLLVANVLDPWLFTDK